ncbi:MAG: hypothetical protein ACTHJH_04855 [Marmoricola sp.]
MDQMLMLHGVDRLCADCATVTIFLPLDDATFPDAAFEDTWICTACDGAVVVAMRGTLAA